MTPCAVRLLSALCDVEDNEEEDELASEDND
jgi:hypothetical protein